MPGLIGIVGNIDYDYAGQLLAALAEAVTFETWYRKDTYVEQGCALGRVSLGLTDTAGQPIWNEERTLCLLMEGEIYGDAEQRASLIAQGGQLATDDDAELMLHLYEQFGAEFVAQLNGSFAVAIWDRRHHQLILATDRMGSHPVYYAYHHQRLLFGPNVHALLVDPDLPRTVDRVAIAEALTFDHILGDRTWLTEVHLLPPASLLIFSEEQLELRCYWTLKYAANYQVQNEATYLEGFIHFLRNAVKRQARGSVAQGMYLSGGIDSRLLTAIMREEGMIEPLATFTWGIPGCDDARFAAEVASQLRTQHHFFALQPTYLLELVDKGIRLTNGSNCVHYHALASIKQAAQFSKIIYKGVMGDAMMGTALTRHFWADYDDEMMPQAHFQAHYERGVLLFTPREQEALFTDSFHSDVNGAVMDAYRQGMSASQATQMADQRIFFDLRHRIPRMTWNGVELVRSQAIVRTPYCDNDLIDFSANLPPGFRFERYLMKKALIERFPALAQIPLTENNLPLTTCVRDIVIRSQRVVAFHLNRLGLRETPHVSKRPYAEYDSWFRTVLRTWVTDTLLDTRTLARGYFDPNVVRQLVAEHMGGANHAVKLGALLGIELWHRQFLD